MSAFDGTCWHCKHLWADFSTDAYECECDRITEDELDRHFTDGEKGCPHYEEEEGGEDYGNS